jgi:hypothetical protein
MRHAWLVLTALMIFVGEADAKRVSCTCPTEITLPERGATGVPINTKIWKVHTIAAVNNAARFPATALQGVQSFANDLPPNAEFRLDQVGVQFTTSGVRDDKPPVPPNGVYVSLVSAGSPVPGMGFRIASLTTYGLYDEDTALVRVDIRDELGVTTLLTTPGRVYLCDPNLYVTTDHVEIEVRAVDLAGNESVPFIVATDVVHTPQAEPTCPSTSIGTAAHDEEYRRHRHHHGHGFEILLLFLLFPCGLIAWLVIVLVRRASINRTLAEPVSLLAAEAVVRRLIRWQVIWSAMLIAGTLAVTTGIDDDLWIFFVPWLFSSFGQLWLQRRALRLLDRPETDAVRRGRWLVVTTLKSSVTVRAADIDFVVGNRRAIPTSVVK